MPATNAWFDKRTRPLWDRHLLPLIEQLHGAENRMFYLELGVGDGQSMLWMLNHLLLRPNDRAVGVDPYTPKRSHKAEASAAMRAAAEANLAPYLERARLLPCSSFDFLVQAVAKQGSIATPDAIYVDGDHAAPSALEDMVLSWRLLRTGGVMIVDDVHRRWSGRRPQVREAVQAFEAAYETRFKWLYREPRQVAYVKVR